MSQFTLQILNYNFIQMSAQKWKEIQRNLAEQESFVQSIIEQRQKKNKTQNNANIDNILTTSIQKAKDKISQIDLKSQPPKQDRFNDNLSTSRQKRQKTNQQGSAIASAMRKLQERISNLQLQNKRLDKQNREFKQTILSETDKNQNLNRSLDENKRKIRNLQLSIDNDKKIIKDLQRKCDSYEKQLNSKRMLNQNQQLQRKLSNSEMMYKAQQQQFKNMINENQSKQRNIMQLQNRLRQQQIRHCEQINILSALNKQMQFKLRALEDKNKQKQIIVQNLKKQLKNGIIQNKKLQQIKQIDSNKNNQNQILESNYQRKTSKKLIQIEKQQIQELKQKYQQLFEAYKHLEQKIRQQKQETKNYRTRFWQLKEATKELIERIQSLPSGIASQFKLLIAKANKIDALPNQYLITTPSKSKRKNSLVNSTSRSKSNSKRKQIKLDLNCSNNSVRSKKSSHTNRSTSSKKSNKSKQKQVIISQKTMKKNEVFQLESEIQQIRKRYKELVSSQNKNDDVSEDLREELNNLAVLLQEKSEQLTKLKRKK